MVDVEKKGWRNLDEEKTEMFPEVFEFQSRPDEFQHGEIGQASYRICDYV